MNTDIADALNSINYSNNPVYVALTNGVDCDQNNGEYWMNAYRHDDVQTMHVLIKYGNPNSRYRHFLYIMASHAKPIMALLFQESSGSTDIKYCQQYAIRRADVEIIIDPLLVAGTSQYKGWNIVELTGITGNADIKQIIDNL